MPDRATDLCHPTGNLVRFPDSRGRLASGEEVSTELPAESFSRSSAATLALREYMVC